MQLVFFNLIIFERENVGVEVSQLKFIRNRSDYLRKYLETMQTIFRLDVLYDVESRTPEIPLGYNPMGTSISLAQ